MIRCITTIGKNERDIINDIYLKKLENTSNKKRRIFRTIFSFCAAVGFLLYGISALVTDGVTRQGCIAILGGLIFLTWGALADKVYKIRLKRAYESAVTNELNKKGINHDCDEKREYTFSEVGVMMKTKLREYNYSWDQFETYIDVDHLILLMKTDNQVIPIDRCAMTEEERKGLYELFEQNSIFNGDL